MENFDVIIIGGGPAGLTAGLYASRARLKTLLIQSPSTPSQALTTYEIENYPGFPGGISGSELVERFKRQAEEFGTEFGVGSVKSIGVHRCQDINGWQVGIEKKRYSSLSVIIASGARPKRLGVIGEERLQARGVSYCAVCDGPLFRGKDIVVVGGGDAGVEEALFLTQFAKRVMLIHRRERLRATRVLQERVLSNEKITIAWNTVIKEILGSKKVEAVRVENIKTKEEREILCDGIFIFIGFVPNTDFVKGLVESDSNGYIIVDNEMKTSQEGIFACGDCRKTILHQIVTACGDGAMAAFSAQQYIEELKGTVNK